MERLFRDFLSSRFESCLRELAPEFKPVRSRGRSVVRLDKVFECAPAPNIRLFLQLQFVKDRDYVLLNCQWSAMKRFPSVELNRKIGEWALRNGIAVIGVEADAQRLANTFAEGWLGLTDFGKPIGKFDIGNSVPPVDRLEEAFTTPEGKAMLRNAGISDWRGHEAEFFRSWMIVGALVDLTADDARYALDATASEMCEFVRTHHLPFLRALARELEAVAR